MRAATLVLLILIAGPAAAQCYRTTNYAQPYHAPAYAVPVYQSYVPHYEHYTQTAVVGAAYPVYLPLLAYTSLADDVRGYYSAKRATKDAYLEALREAAAEGLFSGGATASQPQPPPQPQAANPNVPAAPQLDRPPPVPQPPAKSPVAKAGSVQKILTTRCASCHNPATEPNHVNLSLPAERITGDVRALCAVWTADRSMPKKGEPLSQEEFDLVQAWAKEATPHVVKAIPSAQPAKK